MCHPSISFSTDILEILNLKEDDPNRTLAALQHEALGLDDLLPQNKEYYYKGLLAKKQSIKYNGGNMTREVIQDLIREMNDEAINGKL